MLFDTVRFDTVRFGTCVLATNPEIYSTIDIPYIWSEDKYIKLIKFLPVRNELLVFFHENKLCNPSLEIDMTCTRYLINIVLSSSPIPPLYKN